MKKPLFSFLALGLALGLSACGTTSRQWADGDDYRLRGDKRYQMGYIQSRSDRIKREWWEEEDRRVARAATAEEGGSTRYYTLPGPSVSPDGVKLAPHPVTVPITE